ncbi:MAG: type II toxin-antitoxin system VapC family toxin [Deltaproteobacteria bacterium]|nr:type II toxin-antitoxin system VapC family toxin [Deltaproteobacteria bacterium]
MRYLLDTNVISEAIKTVPDKNVMRRLKENEDDLATASLVWHELHYGCHWLPKSRKRIFIESYLREVVWLTMPILPYDARAAAWHADQRARLISTGRTPPFVDGQIAAVAKVNELILVTRNTRDFSMFEDLDIETWHAHI